MGGRRKKDCVRHVGVYRLPDCRVLHSVSLARYRDRYWRCARGGRLCIRAFRDQHERQQVDLARPAVAAERAHARTRVPRPFQFDLDRRRCADAGACKRGEPRTRAGAEDQAKSVSRGAGSERRPVLCAQRPAVSADRRRRAAHRRARAGRAVCRRARRRSEPARSHPHAGDGRWAACSAACRSWTI